jgi:hypothetical protein
MLHNILIFTSFVLGVLRFAGVKSQAYQAIAHCFVGGLFGAYIAGRDPVFLLLGVGLSIIEVTAFLYFKKKDTLPVASQ